MSANPDFWQGRRVLLTGHTGFKGAWAARWLTRLGAQVTGFALAPETTPSLHDLAASDATSIIGDIRDRAAVSAAVRTSQPEIVLHLAAQPLVRRSYREPADTFATNVMGTVNLLDALREEQDLRAVLIVTTDKVYENDEAGRAFDEADRLGGHDPYAASKAASELAVVSFARSYFDAKGIPVATARGGNVIGGGDWSEDRLIPDIIRAAQAGEPLNLRNPGATRPWQHVLDCLDGYLTFAEALATTNGAPRALNIGPHDPADTQTVAQVAAAMHAALGYESEWNLDTAPHPHEMAALALNPEAALRHLGWEGRLTSTQAIRLTADWYAAWANGGDMATATDAQIADYQAGQETTL
ncbi:MAG: CDP-glucose 4,6-dehydratase [Pseudomonadota bacterium]